MTEEDKSVEDVKTEDAPVETDSSTEADEKTQKLEEENQNLKEQLRNQAKKRTIKEEESEDDSEDNSEEDSDDSEEDDFDERFDKKYDEKVEAQKDKEVEMTLQDFLETDQGAKYSNDGSKEHDENFKKFTDAYKTAERIHGTPRNETEKSELFRKADSFVVGEAKASDDGTQTAGAPGGSVKQGESANKLTAQEADLAKKFGNDPEKLKKVEYGDDFLDNESTKLTNK